MDVRTPKSRGAVAFAPGAADPRPRTKETKSRGLDLSGHARFSKVTALQLRVLSFAFIEDGDVGIGVFHRGVWSRCAKNLVLTLFRCRCRARRTHYPRLVAIWECTSFSAPPRRQEPGTDTRTVRDAQIALRNRSRKQYREKRAGILKASRKDPSLRTDRSCGFSNSISEIRHCSKIACYCNFAYSVLASFRMGTSGSASFQRVRKSL